MTKLKILKSNYFKFIFKLLANLSNRLDKAWSQFLGYI